MHEVRTSLEGRPQTSTNMHACACNQRRKQQLQCVISLLDTQATSGMQHAVSINSSPHSHLLYSLPLELEPSPPPLLVSLPPLLLPP